jgi:hypothetical protein
MKTLTITEKVKLILDPKLNGLKARLFVSRDDGITIYDSVQNHTTTSVAALVSGVWQASEALMNLVDKENQIMDFRLGFDTTSQGIYLYPLCLGGKKYFLGAIYGDCLNPGQLKRQVSLIKDEMEIFFAAEPVSRKVIVSAREGYLFQDISDSEMDRLFSLGGI